MSYLFSPLERIYEIKKIGRNSLVPFFFPKPQRANWEKSTLIRKNYRLWNKDVFWIYNPTFSTVELFSSGSIFVCVSQPKRCPHRKIVKIQKSFFHIILPKLIFTGFNKDPVYLKLEYLKILHFQKIWEQKQVWKYAILKWHNSCILEI